MLAINGLVRQCLRFLWSF